MFEFQSDWYIHFRVIEKFVYEMYNGDFKEEYLRDQWINFDQISYLARLD